MPEYFDPKNPDIGYNGRDQDKPGGMNIGNSEALRALGGVLAGDQGFENTPDAQDREYTAQVLTAGLSARVQTLEGKMAAGAEYSDNFNRINASQLGSPNPGTIPVWQQFGDGQPLELIDQAAQLNQSAPFNLVDDGTRFALCPQAASSPNYSIVAIVHPLSKSGKIATRARTTIYGRCNAAGTEGVYVDFWGGHCELGRFTRSGNAVSRSQWKANTERSYNFSSTPELRMRDAHYVVVVDGVELIVHDDISEFPVDGNHRFSMFSCMTWTGFFGATPEFSAGLTGFAIRGSDFTAIEDAAADALEAKAIAGEAAVVAADADASAIAANNAAAAAAELAAAAAGGQDASNMAYVYNSEKQSMRTTYPASAPFGYVEDAALAVSGTWMVRLAPPNPTTSSYPTMRLGPDFDVISGERIYCEWRQRRVDGANFQARLNLVVFGAAGGVLNNDLSPVQPVTTAPDGVWITYAGIVTMPTGAAKVTPQLKMQHPSGFAVTGQVLFEEIVIRRALTTAQVVGLDQKIVELTDSNLVTSQQAVTAGNVAQEALLTADIAYENAQYWKDECVVASAGVLLGVNELLIGVVMDVPTGRTRKITDLHFAFYEKPGSITIQTKVVGINGVERVVNTVTVPAGNTRHSLNNLNIDVVDKERVFWNVTAQGGAVPANVLQVAVVGVLL